MPRPADESESCTPLYESSKSSAATATPAYSRERSACSGSAPAAASEPARYASAASRSVASARIGLWREVVEQQHVGLRRLRRRNRDDRVDSVARHLHLARSVDP